jgi:hypothetical protein
LRSVVCSAIDLDADGTIHGHAGTDHFRGVIGPDVRFKSAPPKPSTIAVCPSLTLATAATAF